MTRLMLFSAALTVALAQAAMANVIVQNGGFEDPVLTGDTRCKYTAPFGTSADGNLLPDVPHWTFGASSGDSFAGMVYGTAWGTVYYPAGSSQAAFLEGTGTISQTITGLGVGTLTVSFYAQGSDAALSGMGIGVNGIKVKFDDEFLKFGVSESETVTPVLSSMDLYTSKSINVTTAGPHVLSFYGTIPLSTANTVSYLDNVSIAGTSTIPEPSTFILVLVGMIGLLAYTWRKRKQ